MGRPSRVYHHMPPLFSVSAARQSWRLVRSFCSQSSLFAVNAVEPIARIQQCPLGLKTHGVRLCPLHHRMDNALAMVEDAFRKTTLAEVLAEPTHSHPLCELPTGKKRYR